VRLVSRNRKNFNHNYRRLIVGLKSLTAKDFILDGEIVALDGKRLTNCTLDEDAQLQL
jgi:ATP-dependent DNA ligase